MKASKRQTPSAHSEIAMGPPITAEKCWQALAEVLSREGGTKRSGNTVDIRLLVLMREQEGGFFVQ